MAEQHAACRAALYLRLSRDDENSGESESIGNQRKLLTDYAGQHGFTIVSEYVDDGYSGTNFARPDFQRMLRDVDAGKINLILVKDLSRLGRDYIETGRYLELIFPEKGVRFIAVNDGVDTARDDSDMAPFRNVVNELYARDTSRKIRSALHAKMRDGQFIGNFAPYGYQKDPDDKNHLIPDEDSAAVVRELFACAAAGTQPADLARMLNGRGVLPPSRYRCAKNLHLNPDKYSKYKEWTSSGVTRILKDVVYLGHIAQGKTNKLSFKSSKTVETPPEQWVFVQNQHTPLVTKQQFDAVQRQIASRRIERGKGFCNLFSGLAFCADCGKSMSTVGTRKKDSAANLACGAYKLRGSAACTNHFIPYEVLYAQVLTAIRGYVSLTPAECDAMFRRLHERLRLDEQTAQQQTRRDTLQKELEQVGRLIGRLYEDRLEGKISETNFYPLLEQQEHKTASLKAQIEALGAPEDAAFQSVLRRRQAHLHRIIERYADIQTLTPSLLFELIARIEVGQGTYVQTASGKCRKQHLSITFRFLPEAYETDIIY